jgi:zinc protease
VILVDKPERSQAQVLIGQLGADHRREDFPAFLLFNDAFGAGFGGRLFKEVRVKNGWSYYAYSQPILRGKGGLWTIGLAPGNAQAANAVALVRELVDAAHRDGITQEELEQVRSARLNGRPFLADTVRKRIDLELRKQTLGYDRLAATEAMTTITLAEVNEACARFVEPSALVVVLVGTAAELLESLQAQLGPIEVLRYDAL